MAAPLLRRGRLRVVRVEHIPGGPLIKLPPLQPIQQAQEGRDLRFQDGDIVERQGLHWRQGCVIYRVTDVERA